jgi:TonB family protein
MLYWSSFAVLIGVTHLVLSPAQAALRSGEASEPVSVGNEADWVTAEDYPLQAMRAGEFGTTTTRLTVGTNGRVQECAIEQSSGSVLLDDATCVALTDRARFEPARDPQGRPVIGTYLKRVRWTLPEMSPVIEPRSGYGSLIGVIARVHFGSDGIIDECRAFDAHNSSSPQLHPEQEAVCQQLIADSRAGPMLNVPPQGVWMEIRQIRYIYTIDPRWNEPSPSPAGGNQEPLVLEGTT